MHRSVRDPFVPVLFQTVSLGSSLNKPACLRPATNGGFSSRGFALYNATPPAVGAQPLAGSSSRREQIAGLSLPALTNRPAPLSIHRLGSWCLCRTLH